MTNQAYIGIARLYHTKKDEVRALLRRYGAETGTKKAEVNNLAQLLDDPNFAAEFWSLDGSRSNFIGAIIAGVVAIGTAVYQGVQAKKAREDAASEAKKQREYAAQQQEDAEKFEREQQAQNAYHQALMQDKELAWNAEHDYNTTINNILLAVSEQEKIEAKKNTTYTMIMGGVLVAIVVGVAIKGRKK